jgi:folate-dependent phosphoribosylglycinamide formyltransferase PurN
MDKMSKKIVMLCSDCFSTVTLYNYLKKDFVIDKIILEEPMRGMALAKRRIKKLGWIKVAGQVLFSVMIVPLLKMASNSRVRQIKKQYAFDETPLPIDKKVYFGSVNEEACLNFFKQENPDLVIVNGTRIISKKILEATSATFINMHTGITPAYRGVHGGYWAMVQNDKENCGVTIHLVDKGIDTGGILYQGIIPVQSNDNYYTYPFIQFGEGFPLIRKGLQDVLNNKMVIKKTDDRKSALWYHPTIWQYLYLRIFKGKK